jgi:hypothetical protein
MSKTIGNGADAREAYLYAYGASQVNVQEIGSGESRTVMLIGGVVYKVGRDSANRWEHECLTEWRKAGAQWAPQTTIYVGRDPEGGDEYTVLAMPYLPDDGGPVDQDTLAAIRVAAPQTCSENYVSHRGKTYLIDGGDIQSSPPDTAARGR